MSLIVPEVWHHDTPEHPAIWVSELVFWMIQSGGQKPFLRPERDLQGELEPIPGSLSSPSACGFRSTLLHEKAGLVLGVRVGWGVRSQELVWWSHFTQRPHSHLRSGARVHWPRTQSPHCARLWFSEEASVGLSQRLLYIPLFKNIPV